MVAGIRGNPTTEISVRLDELIEAARPVAATVRAVARRSRRCFDALLTSDAGRAWLERFDGFLAFCGQRGPREFDLAVPRWSDDPTMVLDLVRLGLAEPGRERVGARLDRLGARARGGDRGCGAQRRRSGNDRSCAARRRASRAVLPLREAPKHYGLHIFQRMRQAAIELGRRLARSGVLADADDVFFLKLAELESLARARAERCGTATSGPATLRRTIEERRLELADFHARAAPDFVRSDGVPVTEASEDERDRRGRAARHRRLARRRDRYGERARSSRSERLRSGRRAGGARSPTPDGRRSFRAPRLW